MASAYTSFVVVDFVSNIANAVDESESPVITEMVTQQVDESGAYQEFTVQIQPPSNLAEAIRDFESFIFRTFTQQGTRWALVTNGAWPLAGCLKRCCSALGVNLSGSWSKYFDIRREARKLHPGASISDLSACCGVMGIQASCSSGSGNVKAMASILTALLNAGHQFTGPMTWDPDEDFRVAAPKGDGMEWPSGTGGCLRLRGVPWTADETEITQFFQGYAVEDVVVAYDPIGKHKGEAYARLSSDEEAHRAVQERNKQKMGTRYIELFPSSVKELEEARAANPGDEVNASLVLRLRGIPFSVTDEDIVTFFNTHHVGIIESSVHIQMGYDGRPTGCAFVRVISEEDAVKALALKKAYMGPRYVEIYRASEQELSQVLHEGTLAHARQPTMQGTAGTDHVVKLRGLPFAATELDIANFFVGLNIAVQGIHLVYNSDSRPSGEAFVEFQTSADVNGALQKNRQRLGHRYLEVFRSSRLEMQGGAATPLAGTHRMSPYATPLGKGRGGGGRLGGPSMGGRAAGGMGYGGFGGYGMRGY
ncbi:RNA-binding protein fusilli [Diplonema papillatum]|nr:RNA-binding protein fusilli [Diplonema papillatum]